MLGGVERRHQGSGGSPTHAVRPAHTTARPRAGRPWPKSLASVLWGGAVGFVLGAAFWIVLGLQQLTGSEGPRLSPLREPQSLHTPECTSLALDRRRGHTTAEPCLGQVLPLREALATGLADRPLP
jgi:hypothetical protein